MKLLYEALNEPIQFQLTQLEGKRRLNFRIYPVVLLLITILLVVTISVAIITSLASDKHALQLHQQQASTLQQQQEKLLKQSAETEALLALRDAEIETMRQELKQLLRDKSRMQKQLILFDEVLAARKLKGTHILRPVARWQEQNRIEYELILVKGENYPRWSHGLLQFSVVSSKGEEIILLSPKGKGGYKFEMTTQEFVKGSLAWNGDWRPETLFVSMFNLKGKQTSRVSIAIQH